MLKKAHTAQASKTNCDFVMNEWEGAVDNWSLLQLYDLENPQFSTKTTYLQLPILKVTKSDQLSTTPCDLLLKVVYIRFANKNHPDDNL